MALMVSGIFFSLARAYETEQMNMKKVIRQGIDNLDGCLDVFTFLTQKNKEVYEQNNIKIKRE